MLEGAGAWRVYGAGTRCTRGSSEDEGSKDMDHVVMNEP
jgi:hypothetical protein